MPETFAEAGRFWHKVPEEWRFSMEAMSPSDFEIVFHGSLTELDQPERIIIMREIQPFDVQQSGLARRTYVFGDGHTEVHLARNSDFGPWEREHLATTSP